LSRAAFIADQKASHRVPYAVSCRALGVSESWFHKWHDRPPTWAQQRRAQMDKAVADEFKGSQQTYGSPRIHAELVAKGWRVSEKTVAKSMARQGLAARSKKRRKGLTRPDKTKRPFPDLLSRDFTAAAPNAKWCGDITEILTDEEKLYLPRRWTSTTAPARLCDQRPPGRCPRRPRHQDGGRGEGREGRRCDLRSPGTKGLLTNRAASAGSQGITGAQTTHLPDPYPHLWLFEKREAQACSTACRRRPESAWSASARWHAASAAAAAQAGTRTEPGCPKNLDEATSPSRFVAPARRRCSSSPRWLRG
jgi:HTH-like domain